MTMMFPIVAHKTHSIMIFTGCICFVCVSIMMLQLTVRVVWVVYVIRKHDDAATYRLGFGD